ncbi:MAG: ribonuclease HI [Clostridiaceae bacterium]|jgi:ribonuclease HI|nr:ribonuclease HI [Eubacteriales bacterium]MDD4744385.1 ribonuclease HI [Eubacteriales bacterium]NLB46020.1 ribonuclease HI [Clostridiaceae bacterium]
MRDTVEIYTDGACSGNPGPGGWAAVLMTRGVEKEISGHAISTTNNRMEMTAAIEALRKLKRPCRVRLYSDSAYLVSAFTQGWIQNWQRNGWRNAAGDPVSNMDLWQDLIKASDRHQIEWIKVKGHADNPYNNRCDKLAVAEIRKLRLQNGSDAPQPLAGKEDAIVPGTQSPC